MAARLVRVLVTVSGRPLAEAQVRFASGVVVRTDRVGGMDVELTLGRNPATVEYEETTLPLDVTIAEGVRRITVDLRPPETPMDDARIRAAMPSERYLPLALLGRGASGSVYRCRDLTLDRLVAVKLLNEEFTASGKEREEFLAEGRTLARIEHSNLIQIYDLGVRDGRAWMVVQYVDGPDLEALLSSETKLEAGAVAAAGAQLGRALGALHAQGLIHRDVKPSNGLVNRAGRVWLADFGLVRPLVDFTDPRSKIFGTPAYMSPEQLQAQALGPATDVYGLGASLFHLAAGRLPFEGANPVLGHLVEPVPDLRTVVPQTPDLLAEVLMAMMAKNPADRPDVVEVADALQSLATQVPHKDGVSYLPRLHTSDGATPWASGSFATVGPNAGAPTAALFPSRGGATRSGVTAANEATTSPQAARLPDRRPQVSGALADVAHATPAHDEVVATGNPKLRAVVIALGAAVLFGGVALAALLRHDPVEVPPPVSPTEVAARVVVTAPEPVDPPEVVEPPPAAPEVDAAALARLGTEAAFLARQVERTGQQIGSAVQTQRNNAATAEERDRNGGRTPRRQPDEPAAPPAAEPAVASVPVEPPVTPPTPEPEPVAAEPVVAAPVVPTPAPRDPEPPPPIPATVEAQVPTPSRDAGRDADEPDAGEPARPVRPPIGF